MDNSTDYEYDDFYCIKSNVEGDCCYKQCKQCKDIIRENNK